MSNKEQAALNIINALVAAGVAPEDLSVMWDTITSNLYLYEKDVMFSVKVKLQAYDTVRDIIKANEMGIKAV